MEHYCFVRQDVLDVKLSTCLKALKLCVAVTEQHAWLTHSSSSVRRWHDHSDTEQTSQLPHPFCLQPGAEGQHVKGAWIGIEAVRAGCLFLLRSQKSVIKIYKKIADIFRYRFPDADRQIQCLGKTQLDILGNVASIHSRFNMKTTENYTLQPSRTWLFVAASSNPICERD